ncbi:hypothetical protein ACLX1H_003686 [Fusarium chlamydosporum]
MFLGGGNTYPHMPRVSSPLSQTFVPTPPPVLLPGKDIDSSSYSSPLAPGWLLHSPTVQNSFGRSSLEHSLNDDVSTYGANVPGWKQTSNGPINHESDQDKSQEYRNLMPQPRKLPFESEKKIIKADGSPESQETTRIEVGKARKPRKTRNLRRPSASPLNGDGKKVQATNVSRKKVSTGQRRMNVGSVTTKTSRVVSDPSCKRGDGCVTSTLEGSLPTKECKPNKYEDVQCQTDTSLEPNLEDGYVRTRDLREQSWGHDLSSLVVITNPDTLKDLHETTLLLFEQYEKEVASGGDEQRHAEIYLHRIWEKRRDFWLARLQDNAGVQCHCQSDEYFPLVSAT